MNANNLNDKHLQNAKDLKDCYDKFITKFPQTNLLLFMSDSPIGQGLYSEEYSWQLRYEAEDGAPATPWLPAFYMFGFLDGFSQAMEQWG